MDPKDKDWMESAIEKRSSYNPFEENEDREEPEKKETAPESSTESDTDTENPSREGGEKPPEEKEEGGDNAHDAKDVPFHQHPRWKEVISQRDEEREARRRLEEKINALEENTQKDEPGEIPEWFRLVAGEDEDAKKAYAAFVEQYDRPTREQIRKELKEEERQAQREAKEQQEQWDNWVKGEMEKLKADGEKFDKNELLDVAVTYRPTDEEGLISLQKSLDILKAQKASKRTETTEKKKQVARQTDSDNRGSDTSKPNKPTPQELRRLDWRSLVDKFNN